MTAFKLEFLFFTALLGSVKITTGMKNVQMGADGTVMNDMCQDCTQIFELLKDLVSNQDFQEKQIEAKLTATLEQVCNKLPAQFSQICHTEVEKMLPLAITFISSIMNPSDICTFLGLCGGRDSGKMKELFLNHMAKTVQMPTMKLEGSIQCSVCTHIVRTLGYLFPKERTQSIITVLLEGLCREFPTLIQPQCNKLVEKYVQLLVDMLLNSTSPNFICTLLHLCEIWEHPVNDQGSPFLFLEGQQFSSNQLQQTRQEVSSCCVRNRPLYPHSLFPTVWGRFQTQPTPPALSDCDSCLTLAVLTRMHLGSNATESQTASFLDTVCQLHPGAMPKCDTYVQKHGNQLLVLLRKPQGALDICKMANLCVSGEKEPMIAADPCSLGPDYSCKDLQTALDCGVVSFCQRNVWK